MALLRSIFWFALFLAATFAFTVLFEHGIVNYSANAEKEWKSLTQFYSESMGGKKSDADTAR